VYAPVVIKARRNEAEHRQKPRRLVKDETSRFYFTKFINLLFFKDFFKAQKGKKNNMTKMQKAWIAAGLNNDNYSAETASAMKSFAVLFANFIGDRPLPEYSASTNKWRWWDNNLKDYQYSTTEDLLEIFLIC
jgi:hypothetical protein